MDPFEGILGLERQPARHQFVEHGAEGIQIGPVVHRAIHAPGLLWRQVGQRGQRRAMSRVVLGRLGDPDLARRGVELQAVRLDAAVNDTAAV